MPEEFRVVDIAYTKGELKGYKNFDFKTPIENLLKSTIPSFICLNEDAFVTEDTYKQCIQWFVNLCGNESNGFDDWKTEEIRQLLLQNVDTLIDSFVYSSAWFEDTEQQRDEKNKLIGRLEMCDADSLRNYAEMIYFTELNKAVTKYCNAQYSILQNKIEILSNNKVEEISKELIEKDAEALRELAK